MKYTNNKKIIIIGAGFSSLVLAHKLSSYFNVIIYEKSRGYGGRCATRYTKNYKFDHGVMFFQTRHKPMLRFLKEMEKLDIIKPWHAKFIEFTNDKMTNKRQWGDAIKHYHSPNGMNYIGQWLANDLAVTLNTKINTIEKQSKQWVLYDENNIEIDRCDWLISAIPSQQAAALIPKEVSYYNTVKDIHMTSCYSLMLGINKKIDLNWDCALIKEKDISLITCNYNHLNNQDYSSLNILSTNKWATANINKDTNEVIKYILSEAENLLPNIKDSDINLCELHRWKYANIKPYPGSLKSYIDFDHKIASCGDWCIKGTMEGAFMSAEHLAKTMINNSL